MIPDGWVTVREAAELLGFGLGRVYQLVTNGGLPARRLPLDSRLGWHEWRWIIPRSACLPRSPEPPPGYLTTKDAARRLGVRRDTVYDQIAAGRLSARKVARRYGTCWHIEAASVERRLAEFGRTGEWFSAAEFARRIGAGSQTVGRWVRTGRLSGRFAGGRYLIPRSAVEALRPPPGWLTTERAAERLGMTLEGVRILVFRERVPAVRAYRLGRWRLYLDPAAVEVQFQRLTRPLSTTADKAAAQRRWRERRAS